MGSYVTYCIEFDVYVTMQQWYNNINNQLEQQ